MVVNSLDSSTALTRFLCFPEGNKVKPHTGVTSIAAKQVWFGAELELLLVFLQQLFATCRKLIFVNNIIICLCSYPGLIHFQWQTAGNVSHRFVHKCTFPIHANRTSVLNCLLHQCLYNFQSTCLELLVTSFIKDKTLYVNHL